MRHSSTDSIDYSLMSTAVEKIIIIISIFNCAYCNIVFTYCIHFHQIRKGTNTIKLYALNVIHILAYLINIAYFYKHLQIPNSINPLCK